MSKVFRVWFLCVVLCPLLLIGCNTPNVQFGRDDPSPSEEIPDDYNPRRPPKPGEKTKSTLEKYASYFRLFQSYHRETIRQLGGNELAAEKSFSAAVSSLQHMLRFIPEKQKESLKEHVNQYKESWRRLKQGRMYRVQQKKLDQKGDNLLDYFDPKDVPIRTPRRDADERIEGENLENLVDDVQSDTGGEQATQESTRNKRKGAESETVTEHVTEQDITDLKRYRTLFQKWTRLHDQLKEGMNSRDPVLNQTFSSLKEVLQQIKERLKREGHRKKIENVLSRYSDVYQRYERRELDELSSVFRDIRKASVKPFHLVRGNEDQ